MVKILTHPWSVSSVFLGFLCSHFHGLVSVWPVCHCPSAMCCECTPHHLRGEDRRRDGEGKVQMIKKHKEKAATRFNWL